LELKFWEHGFSLLWHAGSVSYAEILVLCAEVVDEAHEMVHDQHKSQGRLWHCSGEVREVVAVEYLERAWSQYLLHFKF
jgi:hypothetical protein